MNLLATTDPSFDGTKELLITGNLAKYLLPYATRAEYREFDFGPVLLQEYVSEKIKIFSYHFFAKRDASFYAQFSSPTIALQFMTAGSVEALLQGLHTPLDTSHFGLFFLPPSINEVRLPEGTSHSIHFELSRDYLDDISASHHHVKELLDKFLAATEKAERLQGAPINYEVRYHLDRLFRLENDKRLHLNFNSIIFRMLSLYSTALEEREEVAAIPFAGTIRKIGEMILQDPRINTYTLKELSLKYNITESRIKSGFKEMWKKPISEFIESCCMEKAALLISESDMTYDEIADELGYENESNFGKAFKRLTGKTPGEMRRQ